MAKKKGEHYVDNKKFLEAMSEWKEKCKDSEEQGEISPPLTNYIGECFLKIATHLSYRPNFINYSYRDEMISDGIQNCLQYAHNFDPEKSKNPFAYFTQIIYYAFLRRISAEKKQVHVRNESIKRRIEDPFTTMAGDTTTYTIDQTMIDNLLPNEDVYKPKKKENIKVKGLEVFMETDD
jgi:hypothetical protein|tara:strand:+ start:1487 stop:2023 length:537 start_codon:yes stop_codon:yes gene_type:complete